MPKAVNVIAMIFCACLAACTSNQYYGYSAEEWSTLNPAQKEKAKGNFTKLVKVKNAMAYNQSIEADSYDFIKRGIEETRP